MMRSLIFAGLLALQIALSTCDGPEIVVLYEGGRLDLEATRSKGNLLNCTIESNAPKFQSSNKKVYSIYPQQELPSGEYNGEGYYCSYLHRDTDLSFGGLWTITTYTDQGNYTNQFIVRTRKTVKTIPADYVTAYSGQWIYISLDTNATDVRQCNVTTPPNFQKYNLMTEKPEGDREISLWGKNCGVKMRASNEVSGQWEINSLVGEYMMYYAIFHVNVPWQSEDEERVEERTWVIGAKDESVDLYDRTALFCQLTKPDGSKLPLTYGTCKMEVPVVSPHHEGTWVASYATLGKMELDKKKIVIKTRDTQYLECTYSLGEGEAVNLLCRTGESSLKFCTFIRPDKHIIHLPSAVGNEDYSYYGRGFSYAFEERQGYAECGVTIRKPSAVDFGLWTCEMGAEGGVRGSVIEVPKIRSGEIGRGSEIENPTVYVKRGDSFKINCQGASKLLYCWLSSPNGTVYSVGDRASTGKSFKYVGKGYTMGECGATVPTSNNTDSGNWTCHLGYEGGFEVEQTVPVKVTDSYLIPSTDVAYVDKTTKLTCRTFIGEDGSLQYCRWVRPNGHGINREDALRYRLTQKLDQCSLEILDFQSEDIGKWTCLAALSRFTDQEEWATIELKPKVNSEVQVSNVLMIVLGSGLLIFALLGASYAAFFVFRKRNNRIAKDPPPYYPADYALPQEIRTGGSPLPTKNDRF